MQEPIVTTADRKSDELLHNASHSSSVIVRYARDLQEWYSYSTFRILAEEICNFPRRISKLLRAKHLRWGWILPTHPLSNDPELSLAEVYDFVRACSDDIGQLSAENLWMGTLERQIAAKSYRMGAAYAFRTAHTVREKNS